MAKTVEEVESDVIARPAGETRFDLSPRWVRVVFANSVVASSKRVRLLLEPRKLPLYYFLKEDVRMDLLTPAGERIFNVRVGDRTAEHAAWERPDRPGYVAFKWDAMAHWFEEDDEVFAHPRDPYHRVDVLNSSRHIKVVLGGELVAETRRPRLLFETGLPTRYYIPSVDVQTELLTPTSTKTHCPYKGEASYWTARVGDREFQDIVWSYLTPIPESPKLERLLCFYNEKVDAIYVDGELQPKPKTPWS